MSMKSNSLNGRQLLVIRSSRVEDDFLTLLNNTDADLQHCPIIDIKPLFDSEKTKRQILDFDNFDISIFVSAHAAKVGIGWLDKYWPMLPIGMQYFAVGHQTASIIRDFTSSVLWPCQNVSSEGLLAMSELSNIRDKRVIIFRGSSGREVLYQGLSSRDAKVEYCDLYDRQINFEQRSLAYDQLGTIDCLIAHSGHLLEALGPLDQLQQVIGRNRFSVIVPSERVAEIAKNLGYGFIIVANSALPEDMFSALEKGLRTPSI